jgi:serpin B
MTFAGARGETAAQLATALRFGLPPARLHAAFNALDQSLARVPGPGVTLRIANALYGQRGTPFQPAFLSLLARDYGAGMRTVDFKRAASAARAAINAWVADTTNGKIPQLLGSGDVNDLTRLVLVNAVYMNAKWQSPFDKMTTSPALFHAPGGTIAVPTMHQAGTFGYVRGPGYSALELPYRGRRLAFDVLLPDPGQLPSLLQTLETGSPFAALSGLKPAYVQLSLPKLLLRTRFELADGLKALGMRDAFDPARADLSGIAGRPGDLFVKAVIHQVYLRVDEAGTEAAASTGVSIGTTAVRAAVVFNVDRPFVFAVRDTRTGAILFLGTVSHP